MNILQEIKTKFGDHPARLTAAAVYVAESADPSAVTLAEVERHVLLAEFTRIQADIRRIGGELETAAGSLVACCEAMMLAGVPVPEPA